LQGGQGIPKLYWSGKEGDWNVMAMELLGHDLERLKLRCGGNFSLSTTLFLIDQMVLC